MSLGFKVVDIAFNVVEELKKLDYTVRKTPPYIMMRRGKESVVIYWRETAGPTTIRAFQPIVEGVRCNYYIVLCMGFFTKHVISYVLTCNRYKGKTLLFEVGLKDYMDTIPKPKILRSNNKSLNDILLIVARSYGLEPSKYTCEYCEKPLVTACQMCGRLLCHNHFIICPICKLTLCSPETGSECFYKHRCR